MNKFQGIDLKSHSENTSESNQFSNFIDPCADKNFVCLECEISIKLAEQQQILISMSDYIFCEQRKQSNSKAEEW